MRKCIRCEEEKSESEFHIDGVGADGQPRYKGQCKQCYNEVRRKRFAGDEKARERRAQKSREWKRSNRERTNAYNRQRRREQGIQPKRKFPKAKPGYWVCRRCLIEKPLDEIVKANNKRGHGSYCLACVGEIQREIRGDKGQTPRDSLTDDDGNRRCPGCEQYLSSDKYYSTSIGYCIKCTRAQTRKWRRNNRDKCRNAERRRELRERQAQGFHTVEEWEALKAQYDYKCLCCGRQEPDIELTRDHVVPLSKGGHDSIDNIQPLCRGCNSSKSIREVDFRGVTEIAEFSTVE